MNKKIDKYIRKELKLAKKRKKECARLYPDWRDDEFNMLECKFIWGVTHDPLPDAPAPIPSFATLNKAIVYYNRATEKYYMTIDDGFFDLQDKESKEHYLRYLGDIRSKFLAFIVDQDADGYVLKQPVKAEELGNYGLEGKTLEDVYFKFSVIIMGLEQLYH